MWIENCWECNTSWICTLSVFCLVLFCVLWFGHSCNNVQYKWCLCVHGEILHNFPYWCLIVMVCPQWRKWGDPHNGDTDTYKPMAPFKWIGCYELHHLVLLKSECATWLNYIIPILVNLWIPLFDSNVGDSVFQWHVVIFSE